MPEILGKFGQEKIALSSIEGSMSNLKDIQQCIDADWTIHIPRDFVLTCRKTSQITLPF